MILSEVGGKGQKKLQDAKVLVIGAGGLGSPAALYLVAAGIGTLGLTDGDVVDLSNLQRQILHTTDRIGVSKVESGGQLLSALNPETKLDLYPEHVSTENIMPLLEQYDFILDGGNEIEREEDEDKMREVGNDVKYDDAPFRGAEGFSREHILHLLYLADFGPDGKEYPHPECARKCDHDPQKALANGI